jgi:hypothetical protein
MLLKIYLLLKELTFDESPEILCYKTAIFSAVLILLKILTKGIGN